MSLNIVQNGETLATLKAEVYLHSGLCKQHMEGTEEGMEIESLQIPDTYKAAVIKKVIQFMVHEEVDALGELEKPLRGICLADNAVPEWHETFIPSCGTEVFTLMMAANYLQVDALLDLLAAHIALLMRNTTPEDLKRNFGIKDDWTDAEYEALVKEHGLDAAAA